MLVSKNWQSGWGSSVYYTEEEILKEKEARQKAIEALQRTDREKNEKERKEFWERKAKKGEK